MQSYPYRMYCSDFPPGSIRRMAIALFMLLATFATIGAYAYLLAGHFFAVWGLPLIAIFGVVIGKKWIEAGRNGRILKFNRECRNFSYINGKEKTDFRAEEAEFVREENGELYFTVRGKELTFPTYVRTPGNYRTMLHLFGGGENAFVDLFAICQKNRDGYLISFRNGRLEVRSKENLERKNHFNRVY